MDTRELSGGMIVFFILIEAGLTGMDVSQSSANVHLRSSCVRYISILPQEEKKLATIAEF